MGYTTEFAGHITITPPLNAEEIAYLTKFANTRRMARTKGPYYVDNPGFAGQDHEADPSTTIHRPANRTCGASGPRRRTARKSDGMETRNFTTRTSVLDRTLPQTAMPSQRVAVVAITLPSSESHLQRFHNRPGGAVDRSVGTDRD